MGHIIWESHSQLCEHKSLSKSTHISVWCNIRRYNLNTIIWRNLRPRSRQFYLFIYDSKFWWVRKAEIDRKYEWAFWTPLSIQTKRIRENFKKLLIWERKHYRKMKIKENHATFPILVTLLYNHLKYIRYRFSSFDGVAFRP